MSRIIQKINASLESFEISMGLIWFSLTTGIIMLGLAMIYVAPHFEAGFNGLQYAILSKDPFEFITPNAFRYRILPPLLGYLTGLRGTNFFILPLIFAILFLSAIYWSFRKKHFSPFDSVLMSALIAFSCVVLIQLTAPGYTDAVYYFFLFMSFVFIPKPYISAFFYCLALLSHESCLFMFPGLVLYFWHLNRNNFRYVLKYAVLLGTSTIPMFLYRYWVSLHIDVEYDMSFYFSEENIRFTLGKVLPLLSAGTFFAFKLFWILPVYILFRSVQKRNYSMFLFLAVMIVCDLAQLVIAYDVTRMLCLAFPIVLISAEELKKESPQKFTYLILILILLNFLIPQYFMSCDGPVRMPSFFSASETL
jgi:hypothetical protein